MTTREGIRNPYTRIEQYIFVQIGDEDEVNQPLRFFSGVHNPIPRGTDGGKWDEFIGAAGFLSISSLTESNRTSANGFQVALQFPPEDASAAQEYRTHRLDLVRLSHSLDIADWPVCVWLLELTEEQNAVRGTAAFAEHARPRLILVGQLGTPSVSDHAVVFSCYTAGSLLDRAFGVPTIWNDFQQNEMNPLLRDPETDELIKEDGAFQFASRSAAEMGVEFP